MEIWTIRPDGSDLAGTRRRPGRARPGLVSGRNPSRVHGRGARARSWSHVDAGPMPPSRWRAAGWRGVRAMLLVGRRAHPRRLARTGSSSTRSPIGASAGSPTSGTAPVWLDDAAARVHDGSRDPRSLDTRTGELALLVSFAPAQLSAVAQRLARRPQHSSSACPPRPRRSGASRSRSERDLDPPHAAVRRARADGAPVVRWITRLKPA